MDDPARLHPAHRRDHRARPDVSARDARAESVRPRAGHGGGGRDVQLAKREAATTKRCEGATVTDVYYLDGSRNQQGPVPGDEIARLIRGGIIRRDTLVWHAGLPDWQPAGQVSEFASLFVPAAAAPRPPAAQWPSQAPRPAAQGPRFAAGAPNQMAPQSMAPQRMVPQGMALSASGDAPPDALVSHLGVWGLFWRMMVLGLCSMFII